MLRMSVLLTVLLLVAGAAAAEQTNLVLLVQTIDAESYKKLVEQFEAQHPDIRVELVTAPAGYAQVHEKLRLMTIGGIPPDVFWTHTYSVMDQYEGGFYLPLAQFIEEDDTFSVDDYFPATIDEFTVNGELVALPRETSTVVMYYNEEMFDESGLLYPDEGWNQDDLLEAAKKLTKRLGDDHMQWGLFLPNSHLLQWPFIWGNGGRVIDESRTQVVMDQRETVEAIQWIADLRNVHGVAAMNVTELGGQGIADAFMRNRLAMFYNLRNVVGTINRNAPDLRWNVAPVAAGSAGRVTRIASSAHAIHRNTRHPEAAWKLLKFLSGFEAQTVFGGDGVVIPSLIAAAHPSTFVDPDQRPDDLVFLQAMGYARPEPVTRNYGAFITAKTQALVPVWNGEKPAAQAVAEAIPELQALINQ